MKKDIVWLPGALIALGGIYTFVYMMIEMEDARKKAENAEYALEKVMTGLLAATSGALIFPMIIGFIAVVIGIIMTRKHFFGLAIITGFLSMMMFNWIGFILTLAGSILAFVIWTSKEPTT